MSTKTERAVLWRVLLSYSGREKENAMGGPRSPYDRGWHDSDEQTEQDAIEKPGGGFRHALAATQDHSLTIQDRPFDRLRTSSCFDFAPSTGSGLRSARTGGRRS